VADPLVREETPLEIAHDRMNFDKDFSLRSSRELQRFDGSIIAH
jgi:hypothetical protein